MKTRFFKHARQAAIMAMLAVCSPTEAQQPLMRDVFRQMPDTLLPTMSHNNRLDMIDFIDSGMKAIVTDNLGGQCTMDTLTADYARISMGKSLSIELKLLPSAAQLSDSSTCVVCMVKTFGSETKESEATFFTQKWQPLPTTLVPVNYAPQLVSRPDTMSAARYAEICPDAALLMVAASLTPADNTLTLTPQIPLQTSDERKEATPLLHAITLKWTGKTFQTAEKSH